jgi:hypothetical protein
MQCVSTIDPVARERDPAYAARRRARWWSLLLVAGAMAGYGGSILGDFPGSSFSFSLGDTGPVVKTLLAVGGLAAAMVILGAVVRLPHSSGLTGQQLFVVATTLLAYTAGFFIGTVLPTVIPQYAETDLEPARRGLRVFCVVLIAAAAVLVGLAARKVRGAGVRVRLRTSGRRVSATVTEVHDTGVTTNNAPWIRLTVKFRDAQGTDRFVRRHMSVSRLSRPSEGDRIALWYDPADPGNTDKIVLGEQ